MIERLTLQRALEFAIRAERLGRDFYERLASGRADDPEVAGLFRTLARDEEVHEVQLAALRDRLPDAERGELTDQEDEYLRAVASAEIFCGSNRSADLSDGIDTTADALRRALDLEKGCLLYYNAVRELLGPNPVIDSIIDAEKDHLTRVMKVMFTGGKMRGLVDHWP